MSTPLVAIECNTYNHQPYIRKCLDGFVAQKTNFPFVIIVHDDASIDGTAEIVQEYAIRFPNLFLPILETENLYSKHDGSIMRIVNSAIEKISPKYVAICEGDDYWIDPLKLQKQVDKMEADDNISFCYTRSQCFNASKNQFTKKRGVDCIDFRSFLLYDETITLTVLIRYDLYKQYYQEFQPGAQGWLMGDTPLWLWLCKNGKVATLDDITSIYTAHQGSSSRTGSYLQHEKFNKSALDIRLFFIKKYDDCKDLIPYLYDKYHRVNMCDAYEFGKIGECIKNFRRIKEKGKSDYILLVKLLPKALYRIILNIK